MLINKQRPITIEIEGGGNLKALFSAQEAFPLAFELPQEESVNVDFTKRVKSGAKGY